MTASTDARRVPSVRGIAMVEGHRTVMSAGRNDARLAAAIARATGREFLLTRCRTTAACAPAHTLSAFVHDVVSPVVEAEGDADGGTCSGVELGVLAGVDELELVGGALGVPVAVTDGSVVAPRPFSVASRRSSWALCNFCAVPAWAWWTVSRSAAVIASTSQARTCSSGFVSGAGSALGPGTGASLSSRSPHPASGATSAAATKVRRASA